MSSTRPTKFDETPSLDTASGVTLLHPMRAPSSSTRSTSGSSHNSPRLLVRTTV